MSKKNISSKSSIDVLGCGILYQEIIISALVQYERQMKSMQNYCRAEVVHDILDKIKF